MNKLIVTNNFEKLIEEIKPSEIFLKDELRVEDVEEIKRVSYIAEKEKKIILIAAEKFNIYAQNALLKILEESPKNIEFILLTKSRYNLLDTIRSRLIEERRFFDEEKENIKISTITNSFIFDLLQKDLEKEEVLGILKELLKQAKNEEELKFLNDAILMLELNIDKKAILSTALLLFKEKN